MKRIAITILFLATMSAKRAPDVHVIVVTNASNSATSLPREQVASIFLRQVVAWGNGDEILPVDQIERSPARAAFARDVQHQSLKALKTYWQQRIFSGDEPPPPERVTDSDVLTYIRSNVGAIGYVVEGTNLGIGVKAIIITQTPLAR